MNLILSYYNIIKSLNSTKKAANDLQGDMKSSGGTQLIEKGFSKMLKSITVTVEAISGGLLRKVPGPDRTSNGRFYTERILTGWDRSPSLFFLLLLFLPWPGRARLPLPLLRRQAGGSRSAACLCPVGMPYGYVGTERPAFCGGLRIYEKPPARGALGGSR